MKEIESIQLDRNSLVPLYRQLFIKIEDMIKKGVLKEGMRLPAIRKLAKQLDVNTVTVVNAYKLLEQKKYIYSRIGSGYYIAYKKDDRYDRDEDIAMPEGLDFEDEDIQQMSRGQITLPSYALNFASATPTPDLFPVEDFKRVLNEVLDRDKGQAFGYHEVSGYMPLRKTIAKFLNENYLISVHPKDIQIISGAQQGIDIIAKALIQPGDVVIMENPTYTGAVAVFRSRKANIIGVDIEQDGINVEMLKRCVEKYHPKLVYLMPNYQNPTTYCYSEEKKKYLLKMALDNNFYIIEDDLLSDLSFVGNKKEQTLKRMDKNNRVLYIKSFSKILMPGLRIGFLIAPSQVFKDILMAKHATDISSSGLIQRALDLYLQKGAWGKHLEYMKDVYEERYNIVIKEASKLKELGVDFHVPNGGLNLWLTLPEGTSGSRLYFECVKQNVLIVPGKIFHVDGAHQYDRNVRISFAAVYPNEIEKGMGIIYNCINKLMNKYDEQITYYTPLM
ncbi:MAG: PLP-dependent aminotransferase family protein [Clostridiaceae bacterium]|nr:PLP-dependent aminotransferase family protein [Clostridiaceae bacterium]